MSATPDQVTLRQQMLARRILSGVLVGLYGAVAGGFLGTVTLWIIGIIPGFIAGAIYGAILGAKSPLHDAVILLCGGFGSLFALLWVVLLLEAKPPFSIIGAGIIFVLSGVLYRFGLPRLDLQTRYWLAWASMAYLVFNVALLFALRS
jgi:hypothetical protein